MKIFSIFKNVLCISFICFSVFMASGAFAEVHYTAELSIQPELAEEFQEFIQIAARDTRQFKGCLHFSILIDEEDPSHVVFYEIWETKEDHEAYRAWRNENNFGAEISPFLAAGLNSHYYFKLPD